MPSRPVCVAILLAWTIAAWELFRRDLLPEFIVGQPPDLRAIARAGGEGETPVRWTILMVDEKDRSGLNGRAVGQIITETKRQQDGGVRLASEAWFDANLLLSKGKTPDPDSPEGLAVGETDADRLEVYGACWIDASGNLDSFRVALREANSSDDLFVVEGRLKKDRIEVTSSGIIPYFGPRSFPYRSHGLVQSTLGPIDRLPGLHVGQSWESQVVSPLTGQVQTARVEVVGSRILTWDNNPVTTLEVVTHLSGLTSRTWVLRDGQVIRQEVPFPLAKLVLERVPPDASSFRYLRNDR